MEKIRKSAGLFLLTLLLMGCLTACYGNRNNNTGDMSTTESTAPNGTAANNGNGMNAGVNASGADTNDNITNNTNGTTNGNTTGTVNGTMNGNAANSTNGTMNDNAGTTGSTNGETGSGVIDGLMNDVSKGINDITGGTVSESGQAGMQETSAVR